jgi:hypothetical protein
VTRSLRHQESARSDHPLLGTAIHTLEGKSSHERHEKHETVTRLVGRFREIHEPCRSIRLCICFRPSVTAQRFPVFAFVFFVVFVAAFSIVVSESRVLVTGR